MHNLNYKSKLKKKKKREPVYLYLFAKKQTIFIYRQKMT
jgi:hypothetical protein